MEDEVVTEKCIICSEGFNKEKPKVQVGEKGMASLLKFSQIRKHELLEQLLKTKIEEKESVLVHKNCRRDFTDTKRSLPTTGANFLDESSPSNKRLRSSITPFNWKAHCFLCVRDAIEDRKNPARKPFHQVTFLGFHRNVIEQCRRRNDEWGDEVYTRLSCSNDLVADEGRYHKVCLQRFMTNKRLLPVGEKGRPPDEGFQQWFDILCIWLEVSADAELYTLQELHSKMTEMAGGESVYSMKRLKQKLQEKYGDTLYFAEMNGKANVVCFQNMVDYIVNDAWYEERKRNTQKDAERIVLTAAKLIIAEIREKDYDTSVYPTNADIKSSKGNWLPHLLKTFLEVLIKSDLKQQSIGQSIVQAAKPRSALMPIPFGLAVELDHVFGSKWLIEELSHLGLCSSYREVTRFKQSAMVTEDASEVTASMPPGTFSQYIADNVDHNICTLDGKGTFHGMGIIQASTNESGFYRAEKSIKRNDLQPVALVTRNKGIQLEYYIEEDHSVMSKKIFKPVENLQLGHKVLIDKNIDLLWEMSFTFHTSTRPSWSGFMQTFRKGEYPGKSEVNLLPIINLNPSDRNCVYSTLLFVIEQSKKGNCGTPCITFDQPLWLKAVEISTEKSLNIVCRLGGFHTLMSFLGSLGTVMKGSGLSECFQVVYGENAVTHVLSGKAVSRALRAHFLLQSALMLKLIASIIKENVMSEEVLVAIKALYDSFVNGEVLDEEMVSSEILEKVNVAISYKMSNLETASRTAKLWIQYINYINIVKNFIAAERTGNWQNHLASTSQMLNLFAATGHINYAKSARLYLQMMTDLPSTFPDLYAKFSAGYHVVRRSDRFWGGLWTDLTIEQVLMRSLKTRGGLTRGRGMSENVMLTWIHTMHICAQIHIAMTELTGNYHNTSNQHAELGANRIKRDNQDLGKIKLWVEAHDPFDENEPYLKNIATGLTATEENKINCDVAEKVGHEIQSKLDGVPFSEAKIKRNDQVRTLETLKTGVQIDNEQVNVDPLLLFSRLLVLVEREEDMKRYFRYELTTIPTSLFENGMMRKASKSNLARAIKENVSSNKPTSNQPYHVLDGGALLHKVKWMPNSTHQSILNQYSEYIRTKYGQSCIVFDGYENGPYVKDHEHKRRAGKASAWVKLTDLQMVATCNQEVFLKNDKNKAQFISALSDQLRREGHVVNNSIGDADTQIVSAALEYASDGEKEVIVVASDTDILVLLMFHWKGGMQLYMFSDVGRNREESMWKIQDLVETAGDTVTSHILFIHAWSGCDTTSAIYGQGKVSILKKFGKDIVYQETAEVFEEETATAREIKEAGLKLILHSYNGKSTWAIEDLRYHQFMKAAATSKTTIKPQTLSPTENAAHYHFLRIHLQVIEWKTLMSVQLNPLEWGWLLSNGSYEPIMTDLNPAPDNVLRFIRCNCSTSKKSPCSTNVCSCRKHGLICVSACGDCHGVNCQNCTENVDSETDDEDGNIFDIFDFD